MDENKIEEHVDKQAQGKPKKGCFARLLKVIMIIALVIVGSNVLLYVLLSIPAIQNKLLGIVTDTLKEKVNTEIRIDEIRLSLFNHATLKGLYVEDLNKDTLAYVDKLDVRLSPWRLLKNQLMVDYVQLDDFVINVNKKDSISDYNFQFLIDAFAGNDTTQIKDTTRSSLQIIVGDVDIKNGRLCYDIKSDPTSSGLFNPSHIAVTDFKANLNLNSIDIDNLDVTLNNLQFMEQSGFRLSNLKGHVTSEGPLIKADGFTLELPQSHLILSKAEYNMKTDEFSVLSEDTKISPSDIAYFLPNAKFLTDNLGLEVDVEGKLPMIDVKKLKLNLGEDLIVDGKAYISSYEDWGKADLNVKLNKLLLTPKGFTTLTMLGDSTFIAPDILKDLGTITLNADLTGNLSKIKLDVNASVRQGIIMLSSNGAVDTTFTNISLSSHLSTRNFNLASLLGPDMGLGYFTTHLDIDVNQTDQIPLNLNAKGAIDLLQYDKTDFKNIPLTAYYNDKSMGLSLSADLPIGKIAAKASMTQDAVPEIHLDAKIDDMDLGFFMKNDQWKKPEMSFLLNGDIKGLDIDQLTGQIVIDSLRLIDSSFVFTPGKMALVFGKTDENDKYVEFNSSILSATIKGKYAFSSISDEIANMMHDYLSNVFRDQYKVKKSQNNFTFTLNVENTEELGRIFCLPIDVIKPMSIKGRISTVDRQIAVMGYIPLLRSGAMEIKDAEIDIFNIDSAFNVDMSTKFFSESAGTFNFKGEIHGADNSIGTTLSIGSNNVGDTNLNINGNISSMIQFRLTDKKELQTLLQVDKSNINIGKLQLNMLPAKVVNVGERTYVNNFGIGMNGKRYFGAEGYISNLPGDTLYVYFDKAEIGDFLSTFDVNHVKARFDGNVLLTNITDKMELYTEDLKIEDIAIFGDTLGTMNLYTAWNYKLGGIKIDSKLSRKNKQYAAIEGIIYDKNDSIDVKVNLDRFPIGWIAPFMAGTLNKLSGSLSTQIALTGTTKAPVISGFLGFNNTTVGIDYTNVAYTISDTIQITPDKIGFDNLTMFDNEGNKATIGAAITHKNFNNMKFNLNTQFDKLMFLNTESRTDSLFYGKVFASGTVRVSGDENNINLDMNIKNDKKSNINISIPSTSEATEYKSIVYINVPDNKQSKEPAKTSANSNEALPLNINSVIKLTPDINLRVVIDPVTGDAMNVKGSGQINFNYDMKKDNMTAYGNYFISDGNVKISLQGLKKFDFKIREGSKLSFVGNPLNTKFDIIAYRRVKADLTTLDASFESGDTSPRVMVDCVLGIKGDMNKMELTYNIELPDVSDDVRNKVNSIIVTDEQKVTQFAYLVLASTFHSQSGGTNVGGNMWVSAASSSISAAMNAVFGNILGDKWEVGTNIESNDGTLENVDMSVDVSTRLLNDKLKLHTNVGYSQTSTSESSFIGDFDAEYQLNKNWSVRAYNKTNDRFYNQAPMVQGVGIVYTKEAATLKQLFLRRKRRRPIANVEEKKQRIQQEKSK